MKIHSLDQGSPEWMAFRLEHFGASEAAAMLGLSKNMTRTELLHAKHTGNPKEYSEWFQRKVLDRGHELEALARPLVEATLDIDLYPITCSDGKLSASCDGITLDSETAWEHKQWNAPLADSVRVGVLPEEHMPQCQQVLMVTGASRLLFTVSDGTVANKISMMVYPEERWFERLRAGWAQFERDLADYSPLDRPAAEAGTAPETLPALRIEITGGVTASNLAEFKQTALAAIRDVNRELKTDQHFADAEKTVKWCEDIEQRLAAAKQHALSQTTSIDELFRVMDEISAEARRVRLDLDRLITKRKTEIKDSIAAKAREAFLAHCVAREAEIAKVASVRLPPAVRGWPDFAGAMKSKRTVASLQDAVDTLLANAKIAVDAYAKGLQDKVVAYRDAALGHDFLFADLQTLIEKPADDFLLAVRARIESHKRAEAEKEQKRIAYASAADIPTVPPGFDLPSKLAAAVPVARPATFEPATLKLGTICDRLGFVLSADFIRSLGIAPAATDKNAKLYRESQFRAICERLVIHINAVVTEQETA